MYWGGFWSVSHCNVTVLSSSLSCRGGKKKSEPIPYTCCTGGNPTGPPYFPPSASNCPSWPCWPLRGRCSSGANSAQVSTKARVHMNLEHVRAAYSSCRMWECMWVEGSGWRVLDGDWWATTGVCMLLCNGWLLMRTLAFHLVWFGFWVKEHGER